MNDMVNVTATVVKSFGSLRAVEGLSLVVEAGEEK
jgi:uncharacterized protein YbaA (DUF1428 family)